jgi:hypothetical protein
MTIPNYILSIFVAVGSLETQMKLIVQGTGIEPV